MSGGAQARGRSAPGLVAVLAATVLPRLFPRCGLPAGGRRRPLQIESLGAGLMLAAHHLFGPLTMESSHGSQNLAGTGAEVLGVVSTLLQAALVIAIWVWYARGPASRDRLLAASAAVVCAFIAFGKVFSPQCSLIWLIPLSSAGAVARRRRAPLAAAQCFTALVSVPLLGLGARVRRGGLGSCSFATSFSSASRSCWWLELDPHDSQLRRVRLRRTDEDALEPHAARGGAEADRHPFASARRPVP